MIVNATGIIYIIKRTLIDIFSLSGGLSLEVGTMHLLKYVSIFKNQKWMN